MIDDTSLYLKFIILFLILYIRHIHILSYHFYKIRIKIGFYFSCLIVLLKFESELTFSFVLNKERYTF